MPSLTSKVTVVVPTGNSSPLSIPEINTGKFCAGLTASSINVLAIFSVVLLSINTPSRLE